jgi:hypothetical protein
MIGEVAAVSAWNFRMTVDGEEPPEPLFHGNVRTHNFHKRESSTGND